MLYEKHYLTVDNDIDEIQGNYVIKDDQQKLNRLQDLCKLLKKINMNLLLQENTKVSHKETLSKFEKEKVIKDFLTVIDFHEPICVID